MIVLVNKIEIIGLGAGDLEQLPLGIYRKLMQAENKLFLRTADHPVVPALEAEGVTYTSFDALYEQEEQFGDVYVKIVDKLLNHAEEQSIIYAVPGHPMLAEQTVQYLLNQNKVEVKVLGGQSYLDDLFTALKIDPIEGFQFVDATSFKRNELQYRQHLIFCQVYDRFIASEVKLALLEDLPPEHLVTIVEAAGSTGEKITTVPLAELDFDLQIGNLTSVYIPPVEEEQLNHTFNRLREVVATLRGPEGCEWDKKQTHESLRPYLIEEIYELIDAIDTEDDEGIIEELGDVLLQVMLHSQIGEDEGYFSVDDVIGSITEKMIRRHPHVFMQQEVDSVDEIMMNWEAIKQKEKGAERPSILSGVAASLPALAKAYTLQKKADKVGFGWENADGIWEKLEEELTELKEAIKEDVTTSMEQELGDVLFVIANLARFYHIQPEIALHQTNRKFITRFQHVEEQIRKEQKDFSKVDLAEMDIYWNEAKQREEL